MLLPWLFLYNTHYIPRFFSIILSIPFLVTFWNCIYHMPLPCAFVYKMHYFPRFIQQYIFNTILHIFLKLYFVQAYIMIICV